METTTPSQHESSDDLGEAIANLLAGLEERHAFVWPIHVAFLGRNGVASIVTYEANGARAITVEPIVSMVLPAGVMFVDSCGRVATCSFDGTYSDASPCAAPQPSSRPVMQTPQSLDPILRDTVRAFGLTEA